MSTFTIGNIIFTVIELAHLVLAAFMVQRKLWPAVIIWCMSFIMTINQHNLACSRIKT